MSSVEAQVDKLSVEEKTPQEAPESTDKTVLESLDFSVVHPLEHEWTMWYLKPAQGNVENWADLLKQLVTVNSVEQFWGAFNSLPRVTQLPLKADFAFFKKGIRPEWEDPANKEGGRWTAHLRLADDMDARWMNILLSLIGNTLDTDNVVNGVFAMVRPKGTCRVQLWVNSDAQKSQKTARNLKNVLNMNERSKLEYQPFAADDSGMTIKIEI